MYLQHCLHKQMYTNFTKKLYIQIYNNVYKQKSANKVYTEKCKQKMYMSNCTDINAHPNMYISKYTQKYSKNVYKKLYTQICTNKNIHLQNAN